jgi:PAS domain S-box-containing protein
MMDHTPRELEMRLKEIEDKLQQEIRMRRTAEDNLRKSRQTLKLVLREMPVIILAIDEDGYLVFFNKEFERVSGYSAAEIKDNPQFLELLMPDDSDGSVVEAASQREWNFRSHDGTEKTIVWSSISGYLPILDYCPFARIAKKFEMIPVIGIGWKVISRSIPKPNLPTASARNASRRFILNFRNSPKDRTRHSPVDFF